MHPILEQFLEKWVWPTAPGARGAPFRLRLTEEKCVKGWEVALQSSLAEIEKGLASGTEDWQRRGALGGDAGGGVQMSLQQKSAQQLSVNLTHQEQKIDPQRMRGRPGGDECKH